MDVFFLLAAYSLCLAVMHTASHWIVSLYLKNQSILSFRSYLPKESYLRSFLLGGFFFLCLLPCAGLSDLPAFIFRLLPIFFLLLIACTDLEYEIIFDRMLLPFALLALPAIFALHLPLLTHLAAAAAGGAAALAFAVLTRGAMGGGDIKLLAVLGLWLGAKLITAAAFGIVLGGIAALLLLVTKKRTRKEFFPYGPWFALSGICCILW